MTLIISFIATGGTNGKGKPSSSPSPPRPCLSLFSVLEHHVWTCIKTHILPSSVRPCSVLAIYLVIESVLFHCVLNIIIIIMIELITSQSAMDSVRRSCV